MTEKEKQIEEMKDSIICAAIVTSVKIDDRSATNLTAFAEEIYVAGYRKQSEIVKEFADKLKQKMYYEFDELIPSMVAEKIDEVAAEYGVEVEK